MANDIHEWIIETQLKAQNSFKRQGEVSNPSYNPIASATHDSTMNSEEPKTNSDDGISIEVPTLPPVQVSRQKAQASLRPPGIRGVEIAAGVAAAVGALSPKSQQTFVSTLTAEMAKLDLDMDTLRPRKRTHLISQISDESPFPVRGEKVKEQALREVYRNLDEELNVNARRRGYPGRAVRGISGQTRGMSGQTRGISGQTRGGFGRDDGGDLSRGASGNLRGVRRGYPGRAVRGISGHIRGDFGRGGGGELSGGASGDLSVGRRGSLRGGRRYSG